MITMSQSLKSILADEIQSGFLEKSENKRNEAKLRNIDRYVALLKSGLHQAHTTKVSLDVVTDDKVREIVGLVRKSSSEPYFRMFMSHQLINALALPDLDFASTILSLSEDRVDIIALIQTPPLTSDVRLFLTHNAEKIRVLPYLGVMDIFDKNSLDDYCFLIRMIDREDLRDYLYTKNAFALAPFLYKSIASGYLEDVFNEEELQVITIKLLREIIDRHTVHATFSELSIVSSFTVFDVSRMLSTMVKLNLLTDKERGSTLSQFSIAKDYCEDRLSLIRKAGLEL